MDSKHHPKEPLETSSYCTVIEGCHELFDLRRAHDGSILSHCCEAQLHHLEVTVFVGEADAE
jgi:hypothetical protein